LRAEARNPSFQNTPSAPPAPPAPSVERPEPRPQFTPPPFQSRATPVPPAPVQAPEPVRPPEPAANERPAPDATLLSDMAKQLEEALKRPASPVPPPASPTGPVNVASPAVYEDISDEEDAPLEPAPAEEEPVTSYDEPAEEEDRVEDAEASVPAPAPSAPPVEPVRTAPPAPHSPAPAPLPPQAKEPASSQEKAADPFSVEDIEAEFARLLGRPLDPNKKG
jgi:flagellar protein FliO/FliZ